MKIKTEELQKALDFFRKNGGTTEIEIVIQPYQQDRVFISGDALGDHTIITIFDSELNTFPKITKTERL